MEDEGVRAAQGGASGFNPRLTLDIMRHHATSPLTAEPALPTVRYFHAPERLADTSAERANRAPAGCPLDAAAQAWLGWRTEGGPAGNGSLFRSRGRAGEGAGLKDGR